MTAFCQAGESMIYSTERKLKWHDFWGEPDYSDPAKAAQISTTVQLRSVKVDFWTGKARFTGSAIMYKNKSWVKPGFKNDYVLSHEQVHFDIAYIAAKKMEADINKLKKVNILNKALIDVVYKNWHSIFLLNEQTYDLMTDGGNDKEMQLYYIKLMAGELKALEQDFF
jgi:hypothetical protein